MYLCIITIINDNAVLSKRSLRMQDDSDIESYCGIPSDREGGFFDPFGLSKGKDEETLRWYRAAELKHGRISMLATLGIFVQGYNTKIIPGFPVTETNEILALKKVYYEAPEALVQVRNTSPCYNPPMHAIKR